VPDRRTGGGRLAGALVGGFVAAFLGAAAAGLALSDRAGAPSAAPGPSPARPPAASKSSPVPSPAGPFVVDVSAEAQLPRLVRHPRTVRIRVVNHAAVPLRVREVELLTDSFAATGPFAVDVVIPAGRARGLDIRYGEARCDGQTRPELVPPSARLVVGPADAAADDPRWRTVHLELAADALTRVLHADCALARVSEAVEVRFGPWTPQPDGRLRGSVVIERRSGDEPVVLHAVSGNILFRLDTGDGDLGTLAPGQDRLEVPVTADASRCDGHAVGEVKRQHRYRFQSWVTIGEDAQLPTVVAIDDEQADQLEEMLLIRCDL
jgi:hypothetical protein